jgi:hypothetical protein
MRWLFADGRKFRAAIAAAAAVVGLLCAGFAAAKIDFVAGVVATHPIAYYRLEATSGKSQVGATTFKAMGAVESAEPGAPIGIPGNHFAKLNGSDAYIATTQAGGVGTTASMMAWVNLAGLPSDAGRFFYVMGESQSGNDLDVQFEQDNILKFYTAAGGHLEYKPSPSTLVNQWHMIVVTLDTATQSRVIYWDGAKVASDNGGGRAGKTGKFTIGASTVFPGRWFSGGIEEVALWDRALRSSEVSAIYAASNAMASPSSSGGAMDEGIPGSGPFATKAKVEVKDSNGDVPLKREEQIAIMFLTAIQQIENGCQVNANHACTMDELLAGPKAPNNWPIPRLKFDPKIDPNYSYSLATDGMAWQAHANPRKPGLAGFYFVSNGSPSDSAYYNPAGNATDTDKELTDRGIEGDSFTTP